MKSLSVFRPRVESQAKGTPEFLSDQVVLDSCIDFCERTLAVRFQDQFTTTADVRTYALPAGTQQTAVKVMRAWCGSSELEPLHSDEVGTPFAFADTVGTESKPTGKPTHFIDVGGGEIALLPIPDATYTITAVVAQKPTRSATQVEDDLYEKWVEAVTSGALARLYSMPNDTGAFNPQLAGAHNANFTALCNRARIDSYAGAGRLASVVRPVWI